MIVIYTPELEFGFAWDWDNDAIQKSVGLYFQTLLPTHHPTVKSLTGEDASIGGFWDFVARIVAGYFIFYFISASRKYHQS